MDLLLEAISSLGILVPLGVIYYYRNDKRIYQYISMYFLLFGVIYTIKFAYGVSRDYIDPFEFPSAHMAFASLLMFLFPSVWSVLFALFIGETRIMLGVHTSIDILIGFIVAGAVYFFDNLFGNKKIRRKYVHIGLSMFFAFLLFVNRFVGVVTLIISLIGYLLFYNKGFGKKLTNYFGKSSFDVGTVNLLVGLLIVGVLWNNAWIAAIYLAWVDGLASVFGHKQLSKSLIGLTGGIIGGIIAAIATHTPLFFAPIIAGAEFFSFTDDNLVVPTSVWLTYFLSSLLLPF